MEHDASGYKCTALHIFIVIARTSLREAPDRHNFFLLTSTIMLYIPKPNGDAIYHTSSSDEILFFVLFGVVLAARAAASLRFFFLFRLPPERAFSVAATGFRLVEGIRFLALTCIDKSGRFVHHYQLSNKAQPTGFKPPQYEHPIQTQDK